MQPFVKWVGGKRQLIDDIKKRMPTEYDNYFEVFIGGGALFFEEKPKKAVINDFNVNLVNVYIQIRDNVEDLIKRLDKLSRKYNKLTEKEDKANMYYEIRDKFNKGIEKNKLDTIQASYFIFLNKSCFNGLYRVNSTGLFNVPSGHKVKLNLYDADNLREISELLQNTVILSGDFEEACKDAKKGDFVFFDSPYYDTFDTYQKGGFELEDHIRLANLFKELSNKGVYCMLTNSNTDFIKELYKDYRIDVVNVKRLINRDASNRKGEEVIITSY